MKSFSVFLIAICAIIFLLTSPTYADEDKGTNVNIIQSTGLSRKEQFLELIRLHRSGNSPLSSPFINSKPKQQPTSPFSHLSQEEIKQKYQAYQLAQANKAQEEIYAPGMESQQAETDTTVVVQDDEHTKNLKRRAVIALAVFLPLLILSFIAFFVYIFAFSKGSNRPDKKRDDSKNSKKSANSAATNNNSTTKSDGRSKNSQNESSTGTGSRTRNNVSTTI
jgi:preprotein translocase subunit SecF